MNSLLAFAPRFVLVAVGLAALPIIGCSPDNADRQPAAEQEEEDTNSEGLAVEGGGGGYSLTTTYVSTQNIYPPTICSGSLPAKDLQKRASAVFDYLIGSGASPTSTYPCTNGSLNYTKLNYIKSALAYGDETAKIRNCFWTDKNTCNISGVKSSRHVLTYSGKSSAVVDALKTLASNVNSCWNGAGTWMQPAKPATALNFEGPGSNNFDEDCRYKHSYVTTTEVRRSSDNVLLSRSYKIGCYRMDPEPATLQSDLDLTANKNAAWATNSNTGAWVPVAYSYQNTWKYDPSGPAGGTPCVSQQAMSAMMGYTVDTWRTGWYVNNFMQASGSYRRCMTQQ